MLESLEFGLSIVGAKYECENNKLKNLKGAPDRLKSHFYCRRNNLITLEGGPNIINGNYNCANNNLINLIGAPKVVYGYFDCSYNHLKSLEGIPKFIGGDFYFVEKDNYVLHYSEKEIRSMCKIEGRVLFDDRF